MSIILSKRGTAGAFRDQARIIYRSNANSAGEVSMLIRQTPRRLFDHPKFSALITLSITGLVMISACSNSISRIATTSNPDAPEKNNETCKPVALPDRTATTLELWHESAFHKKNASNRNITWVEEAAIAVQDLWNDDQKNNKGALFKAAGFKSVHHAWMTLVRMSEVESVFGQKQQNGGMAGILHFQGSTFQNVFENNKFLKQYLEARHGYKNGIPDTDARYNPAISAIAGIGLIAENNGLILGSLKNRGYSSESARKMMAAHTQYTAHVQGYYLAASMLELENKSPNAIAADHVSSEVRIRNFGLFYTKVKTGEKTYRIKPRKVSQFLAELDKRGRSDATYDHYGLPHEGKLQERMFYKATIHCTDTNAQASTIRDLKIKFG